MRHHYVPRFYLKNFAFNTDRSQVYSMTKDGMIPEKPNNVADICQKENYNTPQQEQEQNRLENYYSVILEEFIKNFDPEDSELCRGFLRFVCFMMGSNISMRKKIVEGLSSGLKLEIGQIGAMHSVPLDKEYRRKYELSIAFSDRVYKQFEGWSFAHTGETDKFFITSDNPVGVFNPDNLSIPIEFDITFSFSDEIMPISVKKISSGKVNVPLNLDSVSFPQDVMMIFPITPSFCMLGFSDRERHARYMSFMESPDRNNDPIALINIMTYALCNRAVYSHSMDFLRGTQTAKLNFQDYCSINGVIPSFDLVLGKME